MFSYLKMHSFLGFGSYTLTISNFYRYHNYLLIYWYMSQYKFSYCHFSVVVYRSTYATIQRSASHHNRLISVLFLVLSRQVLLLPTTLPDQSKRTQPLLYVCFTHEKHTCVGLTAGSPVISVW